MNNRCLYCYKKLKAGEKDYHKSCMKEFFQTQELPILPFSRKDIEKLAKEVIHSQTTLTGVQPKLSIDFNSAEKQIKKFTIVGLWGRFILKPQTSRFSNLPELEDLTMHLAEIAGIETVPHSLIRFEDGELNYITRRIDRTKKGEKIGMEDMCQLSKRLTEYKYSGSHEQISKLLKQYSDFYLLDNIKFWEEVIFCWIIGNADMHLKNFSLYNKINDKYMLTPAYDLLSTALVMPEDKEELALTLNAKKRRIKRKDFIQAMRANNCKEKVIENIFNKFFKVKEKWFKLIEISFIPDNMKIAYKKLIEERLKRLEQ